MKRIYRILILFVGIALLTSSVLLAYAHPGRTDSNGGHYNRDTGTYHYHHGYPAHQHINGTCPYDFDDKTGVNSGNASASSTTTRVHPTETAKPNNGKDTSNKFSTFSIFLIFCWPIIAMAFFYCISTIRDHRKKKTQYRMASIKWEHEYPYYFDLYAFYDPRDYVTIPKRAYIRNGIPVTSHKGTYGLYTVYVTKSGSKYHQNENCINTKMTPMHIKDIRTHTPCSKCVKQEIPSLKWYYEYKRISDIKKKYNIP